MRRSSGSSGRPPTLRRHRRPSVEAPSGNELSLVESGGRIAIGYPGEHQIAESRAGLRDLFLGLCNMGVQQPRHLVQGQRALSDAFLVCDRLLAFEGVDIACAVAPLAEFTRIGGNRQAGLTSGEAEFLHVLLGEDL